MMGRLGGRRYFLAAVILRDFRLDTPPPREAASQPAAVIQPTVAPQGETSQPVASRPAAPQSRSPAQPRIDNRPTEPAVETVVPSTALPTAGEAAQQTSQPEISPMPSKETPASLPASNKSDSYWPWLAGLAAIPSAETARAGT
jgi:hypothetical protein